MEELIPDFPKFRPLMLADKSTVDPYLAEQPPEISEYTFTNLFAWRRAYATQISHYNGNLYVLHRDFKGKYYFTPPLGKADSIELLNLLFRTRFDGQEIRLERAPTSLANKLQESGFSVESDRANSDYVYLISELAELKGRKFSGKRNRIKKCLTLYDCKYETITMDLIDACMEMQDRWCQLRECGIHPSLCYEYQAIHDVFTNFAQLKVLGAAILIKGQVEAYTIGEPLNEDTAVVHFEKAMPEFVGLSQLINQWFCQQGLRNFTYVNREQDLGVEGLRRAKESYYPHYMVDKYIIWPKPVESTINIEVGEVPYEVPATEKEPRCAFQEEGKHS